MPPARRKSRLFWLIAFAAVAIVGAGLVAAWALLRSDPSWYERVALDAEQQAAGERELRDRIATLHNDIGRSQVAVARGEDAAFPPFEVRIGEDEVNGVIARWFDASQGLREAMGEIREPHVRFLRDRVELAGRSARMDSLISIELGVERDADGVPTVRLGRPWAGRLPLSRSLIDGAAIVAKLRADGSADVLPAAFLDALVPLLNGSPVRPPIVAVSSSFNGATLLPARVEKLAIDRGELVATLRPFTPDAPATQTAARR